MDGIDLDELVAIWEHWTEGDPTLRRAVQAATQGAGSSRTLMDEAAAHLTALTRQGTPGDTGIYVAVLAGSAVLLALGSEHEQGEAYRQTVAREAREAQDAHRAALAAAQQQ